MRNPSAITYYFGSKAELIEDLVAELFNLRSPVLIRQIELADGPEPPSIYAWAEIPVSGSAELITTERGCLFARLCWEYDGYLHPDVFEEYLASADPVATDWLDAVTRTLPDLPLHLAVFRNIAMFRTLEWMIARRASRLLVGLPPAAVRVSSPEEFRATMQDVVLSVLDERDVGRDDGTLDTIGWVTWAARVTKRRRGRWSRPRVRSPTGPRSAPRHSRAGSRPSSSPPSCRSPPRKPTPRGRRTPRLDRDVAARRGSQPADGDSRGIGRA